MDDPLLVVPSVTAIVEVLLCYISYRLKVPFNFAVTTKNRTELLKQEGQNDETTKGQSYKTFRRLFRRLAQSS